MHIWHFMHLICFKQSCFLWDLKTETQPQRRTAVTFSYSGTENMSKFSGRGVWDFLSPIFPSLSHSLPFSLYFLERQKPEEINPNERKTVCLSRSWNLSSCSLCSSVLADLVRQRCTYKIRIWPQVVQPHLVLALFSLQLVSLFTLPLIVSLLLLNSVPTLATTQSSLSQLLSLPLLFNLFHPPPSINDPSWNL